MGAGRQRAKAIAGMVFVAVLAAAIVVGVRWALDPETIRAEAETRLQQALGQPVSIGDMRITWLPQPALAGSAIRIGDDEVEAPALALDAIRIVPRPWSLVRRPIHIEEVFLEGVVVSILRDDQGAWHAPVGLPAPGPSPEEEPGFVIERVSMRDGLVRILDQDARGVLRERARLTDLAAEVLREDAAIRLSPVLGRVGDATLKGDARIAEGAADMDISLEEIRDGDLPALLALAGAERPEAVRLPQPASVDLKVRIESGAGVTSGSGVLRAPEVTIESLRLEGVEAPIALKPRTITLAPATFSFYEGRHEGTVTIDLARTPARWSADSRVSGLNVGGMLDALTGRDHPLEARGTIIATVGGVFGQSIADLGGKTSIRLDQGMIRQFALIAAVNRAVKLADVDPVDTRFDHLTATLVLGGREARTDDLRLETTSMRVELAGRIGFDGALDLVGVAILPPERSETAIRAIRELATLQNPRGELELPLAVGGTIDDPSFSVEVKAAAGKILREELRRRLREIIR